MYPVVKLLNVSKEKKEPPLQEIRPFFWGMITGSWLLITPDHKVALLGGLPGPWHWHRKGDPGLDSSLAANAPENVWLEDNLTSLKRGPVFTWQVFLLLVSGNTCRIIPWLGGSWLGQLMEEIRQSPVDMEKLPLFTWFYTSQVVSRISSINRITPIYKPKWGHLEEVIWDLEVVL